MRIVIVGWHVKDSNVGLGRYTRNLIESLGRVDRRNEYEVLLPVESESFPSFSNVRYHVCRIPGFKRRVWEQVAPCLVKNHDLVHLPYDSCLAHNRAKLVVTIHDVKPLLFPKGKKPYSIREAIKHLLIPDPLSKIDHIITVSECSKNDIVERLKIANDRVTVIPQGVEHEIFCPASSRLEDTSRVTPYILSVAGADPTKNLRSLILAYSRLPVDMQRSHQLILVGDLEHQGKLHQLIEQNGIRRQTICTGIIPDERLIHLYQNASLFVFPSLYEGFGLPVLEAMACGCPVLCSNTSSLPEVVGDAAMMVSPLDIPALESAMRKILTDSVLQKRMRLEGRTRSQQYSWDRTALQTVELYERVVRG